MTNTSLDALEQFIEPSPSDEIPRDGHIRQITKQFSRNNQIQVITGNAQIGRTNLLAQFARHNRGKTINYFVNDDPLSQRQHGFYYSICTQLAIILGKNEPGERISLEELKSMLTSLSTQLATRASQEKEYYYFVIDGLEYAFTGTTGNRIIDELPLRTYPNSPYILFSCRTDQIEELPSKIRDALQIEPLPFDKKQTQIFLDGLGFSLQEIDIIHEQCEGVAGYLRIVKNVKLSDPSAKSEQFQPDFNKLVNQHLDVVLKQNYEVDAEILSTLAASPTSVPYQVLIKMINVDEVMVNESLKRLAGLVYYDANKYRVSYKSEFAKKAYVIRLNDRVQHYRRKLITCIEEGYESDEDLLLMLLYRDDQDYEGFQQKISNQAILSIIGEVGDVSSVLKKLSIATEMATNPNRNDLKGLIKWTHGVLTAKSFIMHAVDQDEIKALLSIKNIEAALGRIYALPETVSKIRLLARAYLAMKEDNQRVSKAAKDELEAMVSNLKTDHLDREFIQDLALDLLPIVPDTAISLLEKTIGKIKSRSIFDAVIDETPKNQDDEDMGSSKPKPKKRVLRGDFAIMFSHWLRQLSFENLLTEVDAIESTNAKEYMLRQWCQKNSNDPDIASAIRAWLEIVVDDTDFVIPLQSLRQISKTIINVPLVERRDLINQIKIPKITSVESPKEEWIGLRANLAEATRDLDMEVACGELEAIYDDIISKVVELDEKTYCFSLLNLTLTRSFPEEKELLQKTSEKFSTSLYELLEHSAEHFAPLRSVLRVLTNIDPQAANIVASELNTAQRRIAAFSTILDNMLQEQAKSNVSSAIHDALEQLGGLDESSRDDVLIEGTYTMIQHSEAVSDENLGTLFKHAQKVRDWKIRSRLSMNLAVLYSQSNKQTDTLIDQAIQDWHNIDDLNVRISVGFEIVEQLALIDNDRAMDFFTKVQDLYLEAGSSLATGTLGVTYIDGIKLAIRAINTRDLETLDQINRQIQSHIERIPSRRVRVQLIATLAARNYCLGHGEGANDIVRTKILPQIRQLSSGFEKDELIEFCLPVIFEYDSTEAENFAENLFMSAKNRSWSRAINWFVSRAFLYDLHSYYDNESVLDVNDYPRLRLAAQAIKHLTYDYFVYQGIRRVCQAVVVSFDEGKINSTQALSVLNMLEIYIQDRHKLPDKENIKHEGYVILVESCIHGVLSKISLKDKRIRQKSDITDRWKNIHSRAQQIPNAADRIFVMALIARDWCQFLKKNRERHPIEQMLTDAVNQIDTIPTLMDRIERLEIISNSWQEIGQKERAISVLRTVVQMIGRLSLVEKDERIATIIQIAYKLDPDFAAEINSTLDTRKPKSAIDPLHVTTQREKLVREPSRLDRLHQSSGARGIILGSTSRKLLADFATGRGVTHSTSTLMKWLAACQDHNPQVIADVLEWVVESLRRSQPENFCRDVINTCLAVSDLAYNLSGLITSDQRAGIPAGLQDNFSGFESKYICFQTGEADRAKTWLQNWIQKNTEKYLKICDPYFGLEQMDYLKFVPSDCLVWIITTDKCLGSGLDGEQLKKEIEAQWRKISSSMMPLTNFLVIPANCEDKFHDRAIISMSAGLDLGQSLNGVGKSRGKVNILIEYEAKELENTYVDPMLQTTNWFNQGVKAIIFQIGT